MGFKGVVVSDAMNMGGAAGYYPSELETAVASFVAGVDIVLWPELRYLDTVEARILRKEIPMSRLDDALSRIWAMRQQYDLLKKKENIYTPLAPADESFIAQTAKSIAEKSVTVVKTTPGILPLTPSKDNKIMLVALSHSNKASFFEPTKKMLEDRGFKVSLRHGMSYFDWNWRLDSLLKFDRIIICFENKYLDPVGSPMIKDDEAKSIWCANLLPQEKIIGISYSNPYYPSYYLPMAHTLINAYSSDKAMQSAVVQYLVGEMPAKGISPINLDPPQLK
jgi:beta-N-acetylhexosaminidase